MENNKGRFILQFVSKKRGVQITPEMDFIFRLKCYVWFLKLGLFDFGVFWSWTVFYIHLSEWKC